MDSQLQVIVVGSSSDDFVRDVLNLSNGCDLDTVLCDDVYSGVSKLGLAVGGLVVGRLEELSRENGRFFDIARMYGFTCCCFVDDGVAGRRRELIQAMERGAHVVAELGEIDDLLTKLSGSSAVRISVRGAHRARDLIGNVMDKILGDGTPRRPVTGGASDPIKDELLITKAEMNALLGA